MLMIVIPGVPIAKARPRVFRMKTGITRAITPETTVRFEQHVKLCAMEAINKCMTMGDMFSSPIKATIDFYYPCPMSQYRKTMPRPLQWRTKKPDVDNLTKSVLDALNGMAYNDDSQVVILIVRKIQSAQGEPPKTTVCLEKAGIINKPGELL